MTNIADFVWQHADARPGQPAVRTREVTWSYGELRDKAGAYAGALASAGIERGDRVLLIAPSVPEFLAAYYGAHALGAVVITMNTMAAPPEIAYVLQDSGARLVIAWHAAVPNATTAARDLGIDVWPLPDGAAPPEAGEPVEAPVDAGRDATAILLYTSGTTGRPKGVELTQANLIDTAQIFAAQLGVSADERFGTALPLFHVFGQCVCLNAVMAAGASMTLLSPFDPVAMVELVRDHQLNVLSGVPTMWIAMLHVPGDYGPVDVASLRLAASGGASLPVEVIRAFEERFGCTILEGYGLTESTGGSTYHALDIEQRPGTVGVPLPGTTVEVRSPEGTVLPAGEVGEVFMAGPTVMKGYWNNPEATAVDLPEGWLRTGDLGALDEGGYLRIVDRAKDLIIRGGYNVYPREVEEVLYTHPDVVEAAVVGVPHETLGEEVGAVLVTRAGADLDVEAMRDWLKGHLSAYKVPHLFRVVEALPKGATGKVLKRAIDWQRLEA
ncbi:class I adenylate-forming enzyme family protein [Mobilicoccus caccae]|uniref:AMP-dependent synthetase n=1 Tax=Mobilicoccus caccae TaxID=1859295 RepID=A0ABQ6IWF0_9MICO|nr:long-chain fatty acid--CoA ligase [Mobilicoccus caccae]GMA41024.1 AMP-dependent synthetase [Mobilicoccus caccae]